MIGGGKGKFVEFPGEDPSIVVDADESDTASQIAALEGMEGDPEVGIGMFHRGEEGPCFDRDSELLPDFSLQATFQILARFELSPRTPRVLPATLSAAGV